MNAVLRVIAGHACRQQISVVGPRLVVGRARDCDWRLMCPMVSRHHCEILADDDGLVVRDMNSQNGTFVNGEQVAQRRLATGDRLCMGFNLVEVSIAPDHPTLTARQADPICLPDQARTGIGAGPQVLSELLPSQPIG